MTTKKISYNEAIQRIEKIIQQIENDDLDVDILSDRVKEVASLLKICKDKLHKTETEVEKILKNIHE